MKIVLGTGVGGATITPGALVAFKDGTVAAATGGEGGRRRGGGERTGGERACDTEKGSQKTASLHSRNNISNQEKENEDKHKTTKYA